VSNSSTLDRAIEQIRMGNSAEAEAIARAAVSEAEAVHGAESLEWVAAQFDLAQVCVALEDFPQAAATLQSACAVPARGAEAQKARLTGLMNLGEILIMDGRLEEAESIQRDGLRERAEFYGLDHPGYAYGLESLALVLLRRGKAKEAASLIEQALTIFWDSGHEKVASVLPLRAYILKTASGPLTPSFNGLESLPDSLFAAMVEATLGLVHQMEPGVSVPVLLELLTCTEQRSGGELSHLPR
jgi:tetratricopeptide (TPR) repeat protein